MESIHDSFKKCNKLFIEATQSSHDESFIKDAIDTLGSCLERVEAADLYSKGEELEEYSTQSLKFLCLKYFLAKVHTQQNNLFERKRYLELSRGFFKGYLHQCAALRILEDDDVFREDNDDEGRVDPNKLDRRGQKIAKYVREKKAKERMESLQMLLNKKGRDGDLDCEEETRSLLLLQLQSYGRDSVDEMDLIQQEIVLLNHMEQVREEQEQEQGKNSSKDQSKGASHPGDPNSSITHVAPGQGREGLPERDFMDDDVHGNGISVVTTSKVGDQVFFSREERISSVFRPSLSAPTMSLEEFGDQQKAEAEERARNEKDQESHVVKRYAQLLADGEEDDADLLEKATHQDREWDAWKEDNPRGSGNKMGKRY